MRNNYFDDFLLTTIKKGGESGEIGEKTLKPSNDDGCKGASRLTIVENQVVRLVRELAEKYKNLTNLTTEKNEVVRDFIEEKSIINNQLYENLTTSPVSPQKNDMVNIKLSEETDKEQLKTFLEVITSYYAHHGVTAAELDDIGGSTWEEVKANPELVREMTEAIGLMKMQPPDSLCDIPIDELQIEAGEDWMELVADSEKLYAFADAIYKRRLIATCIS
ncbi:hypothetical protein GAMM_80003 [Gammaproteobacteria bacterium]